MESKKKTKPNLKAQTAESVTRLVTFVAKHRVTIMIVLFGAVVSYAFFKAQTYTDPGRNEAKFEELVSQQKVTNLDLDLVEKIKNSVDDGGPTIGENPNPDRTNPFTE